MPKLQRKWSNKLKAFSYDNVKPSRCQCPGSTTCKCGKGKAEREEVNRESRSV